VKLTVLAARVDAGGKFFQEFSIRTTVRQSRGSTSSHRPSLEALMQPSSRELSGIQSREKRCNTCSGQLGLAVAPDVFKKRVAERDVSYAIPCARAADIASLSTPLHK